MEEEVHDHVVATRLDTLRLSTGSNCLVPSAWISTSTTFLTL